LFMLRRVCATPRRWGWGKTIAVTTGAGVGMSGASLLGWSWYLGMSPTHVVEQSFRSLIALYAVSHIAVDYKLSLLLKPDLETLYNRASTAQDLAELEAMEQHWNDVWEELHDRSARRLLWLCQRNAGIFTKAGQHLASLNHVLPPQYTQTLSVLQDKAPFESYEEIARVVREDLGMDPEDAFASFEKTPIAAASLAQVHRATLDSGEEVAVKIQYPHLSRMVDGDIKTIENIVRFIAYVFPSFEFTWILPEFRENITKELDFRIECANSERAARNFARYDATGVYIPRVHHSMLSRRVLVMEFIHGTKVNNVEGLRKLGLHPKDVTTKLIDLFSDQIFLHGFVHCDPHPGNLLVRVTPEGQPEVVILDHGLYRELSDEFRVNYCRLWKAIVLRDTANINKYSQLLGAGEFAGLFSVLLTLRPSENEIKLEEEITNDDIMAIANILQCSQSQFAEMLKNMDRDLLFVLRTTYLLQSINLELGTGTEVNRFNIMARHSIRGTHIERRRAQMLSEEEERDYSVTGFFSSVGRKLSFWKESIMFEINLALANGILALFLGSATPPPTHKEKCS